MSSIVQNRQGKDIILLNPYEKGTKFFDEITNNVHLTNDGFIKYDKENNKPIRLTDVQRAYRSGYLQAQKDSRKAFKAKNPNYKSKKN